MRCRSGRGSSTRRVRRRRPRSILMVEGVVALARTFGVAVKAQGVRDAAQAELLRSIGCDCAWGPYFGAPVLAGEPALAGSRNVHGALRSSGSAPTAAPSAASFRRCAHTEYRATGWSFSGTSR